MKKLLIVSPHFSPVNAPDMHRVRLALPHLRSHGWEPTVLAVHPDYVEGGVRDALLEETYPSDIRVVRVMGISPRLTRRFHIGGLWLRCGRAIRRAGEHLLRSERFDLVFFSTTQFGAFTLGPRWKRKFGVPYVLDYQDPWGNDHYARTGQRPPGGRFKFALSQRFARKHEPVALRHASGVISVSNAYGPALAARYPWFDVSRVLVLPFGASALDLDIARNHPPASALIPFGDGNFHHVYTGRGGDDMRTALTILFRAFKRFSEAQPDKAARIRFHFIGTSYAPPPLGRESVMPVARAEGVEAHVHEHCARVSYFEALFYLAKADAVLAIGSNDAGYSASKIFPCLLARRPLLALFHQASPVHAFVLRSLGAPAFEFGGGISDSDTVAGLSTAWFESGAMETTRPLDSNAFAPFTAEGMTRSLVACFEQAVSSPSP